MARLILDSGAASALAAGQARARAFVERAVREGDPVVIPAVVVAETTRGGPRDALVNRVIKAAGGVAPATEAIARQAGRLLAAAALANATVDALIVAEAARGGPAILLTGDLADLSALATGYPHIRIYGI